MSSTLATAIPLTLLVLFFVAGMPIGIALGVAGVLGLYLSGGADAALGLLTLAPYGTSASFILTAVPMFVLMAEFCTRGGIARDLPAGQGHRQRLPRPHRHLRAGADRRPDAHDDPRRFGGT